MKVIDHDPQAWFLLRDKDALYLDVNCNHSAFGYSWMIELNEDELNRYASEGRAFLNQLAQSIQYSAPIVIGSTSPYKNRDVSKEHSVATVEAVQQWNEEAQQDAP